MIRILMASWCLFAVVAAHAAQSPKSPGDALVDELVWGAHGVDLAAYPPDVKAELTKAVHRSRTYHSRRPQPANSSEMEMVHAARVGYERLLVTFANDPKAQALAVEYVSRLHPCYEWEGYHDCPEREASFATAYLSAHSDSPFKDYLPLLAAHRWLCAAEGYDYEKRADDAARSRREYQSAISTAHRSASLLVRTAAQALEARGRCH